MVTGVAAMKRRFAKVPQIIKDELQKQIAKEATKIVAEMKSVAPRKDGDLIKSINWTWGDAPAGSVKIGQAFGNEYGQVVATIYVGEFYARFLEFGTVKMPASPFFFPVYRANKTRVLANLKRALTRAMKKA